MAEPLWTPDEIETALEADAAGPVTLPITGVSIDTRTLEPGDLFVAIKGDRSDGHDYVQAAFEKGAAAAIVKLSYPQCDEPLFPVPDTLHALNALGRAARTRTNAKIVGVTGSVGKTGTKEMLRAMLSAFGDTHASEKSYNNHWGVPLSLGRMPRQSAFGVFEMGMNHAGEISPLTRMVQPHVAIVTWVAPVHIEFFDSVMGIADAKAEIFEGVEPGGYAVLPRDNEHYERLARHAQAKGLTVVRFGSRDAGARVISLAAHPDRSTVDADILGERVTFTLPVPGPHHAMNAIAGLAAAKLVDADIQAGAAALAGFTPPEGRGHRRIYDTDGGSIVVIDETYNANPASMAAALAVLGSIPRHMFKRRIAVLGDMLELGHAALHYHADLAEAIDSHRIDLVFCAGPLMKHLFDRLSADKRGVWRETSGDLIGAVIEAVSGGDAITVKGSAGSKMALLVQALDAKFSCAERGAA